MKKVTKIWQISPSVSTDILEQILFLRGCQTSEEKEKFLKPPDPKTFLSNLGEIGLTKEVLEQSLGLIQKAIEEKKTIIIHGDYDVDGICATAILWRTIYQDLGYKNCLPFIPNRFEHGYGLSKESIDSINNLSDLGNLSQLRPLLITVDCGITAYDSVSYAKEKGLEVLIVDHHAKPEKLPGCQILWTDKLCATGLAWTLSQRLLQGDPLKNLDLVALATIADLQPLIGPNRSLVKFGLEVLNKTENVGLKCLVKSAGIEGKKIGTFEVGWLLAPRLNAAGRLEDALASLRLLCTNDENQAAEIAQKLNQVNAERQDLTKQMMELALDELKVSAKAGSTSGGESGEWKVKVVAHEEFHEGIIGLVAGKLVQEFAAPAVVISKGPEFSKASARSVSGFNIVEFLRSLGDHFENVGGHAGAAGFTIKTDKIDSFLSAVNEKQPTIILPEPVLKIDAEIKFEDLNFDFLEKIFQLEPFGLGNPEPVFLLKNARVVEARTVGAQGQHLKMKIQKSNIKNQKLNINSLIDCIGFDFGDRLSEVPVGQQIDLVFYLTEDKFNGHHKISLKIKDFKPSVAK